MNYLIRKEKSQDYPKVREVIKSAFSREGKDLVFNEWVLVEKIRESEYYINDLSLVAEAEGEILGHIMFTPMKIEGDSIPFDSLALAPVAVHKDFQKRGIGKHLVRAGIENAKNLGFKSIIVMGDPEYYTKFGFEKASKWKIGTTNDFNDNCLFALELVEKGLVGVSGIIEYCPPFYNEKGELI
ncbi:GNAT family N-acetyltransferase [Maledivibacter halophilus]|uniref:Predicted N-acetyltransferase YhbS n=1 Tax=Maledivibacter halophilus TaxID=36842 RepID=A0A1T5IUY4_9FIRM|nr:N-acetyltransferase [Maledivibacter halophilus]SKC42733.1 Predicted N-acetyltransferase YhbS [Maledivibacter halophilus]